MYAHEKGIHHHNIKDYNIFVEGNGSYLYLGDFDIHDVKNSNI